MTQINGWSPLDAINVVEGVDGDYTFDEQLRAWQYLIDIGMVWKLQGWYGRTAKALIERGLCWED
jgi:hypothetical protein